MDQVKPGLILQFTGSADDPKAGGGTTVWVGTNKDPLEPNSTFVSNPKIRTALYEQQMHPGDVFGAVLYDYNPKKREIAYAWYFPIPSGEGFNKKGIAKLIEFYTIRNAKKLFPKANKIKFRVSFRSSGRVDQLRRMGLTRKEIAKGVEFEKYFSALKYKLHRDAWKAKGKLPAFKARQKALALGRNKRK